MNKRKITKINKGPKPERGRSDLPSITARADDAFGSKNYAEFSVDKKKEGQYKSKRSMMLAAYILGAAVFVAICAAVKFLLWFIALTPLFLWMAVYFTWPYVSIEYKYTVDHALLTVKTVYGDRYEELMFEGKIKDFSIIAPYNDEYKKQADDFASDAERVEAYSSAGADDIYFGCHTDENGKKTVVFFEMTAQALGALKYYNSSATVISEVRR
ncbi:MAG: hypothetical protein IKM18_09175 [Clostridia bacterium]|nr:hypothetical protein [Clostridia bacterium]